MKLERYAGLVGCFVVVALAPPALAEQVNRDEVPPPEEIVGMLEECVGINALGEAGHYIVPEIETLSGAGISFDRQALDAAYIEPAGYQYDDEGEIEKWLYRVTGKSSKVNCPGLDQAPSICAESPALALQWSSELLEWVEEGAGLGDLPPLPTCPDPS